MDPRLSRLEKEIASAIHGITLDQLTLQKDGKWSVAEILEHLFMTYTGTSKGLERCLQAGRSLATRPSAYHRFATFALNWFGIFSLGENCAETGDT